MSKLTLAGKTLFVTGASRGIGLAVALRAAREGANIVIAAKTAEPHPKLPGTIYTAAQAVEAAGGRALPLILDVRDETAVEHTVAQAANHFGGIDICVNNASALKLSGTLDTAMKSFDLMHQVNARATFVTSRACLPYLLKSENPHILAMAPPLPIQPGWFGPHLAYSLAKFGMSLCVLGLSEEFREAGIAVNALWPRTIIGTAAIEFGTGPEGARRMRHARRPEIMADAAHEIFTTPSREITGRFFIDDALLAERGISDFSKYQLHPGIPLQIDMFIPVDAPPPPGVELIGRDTDALSAFDS
jgi:citronellol/citronellal dehydrogenase